MRKFHFCQYGNCNERTAVPVVVTHRGAGTKRYCCDAHAAASLLKRQNCRWFWLLVLLLTWKPLLSPATEEETQLIKAS